MPGHRKRALDSESPTCEPGGPGASASLQKRHETLLLARATASAQTTWAHLPKSDLRPLGRCSNTQQSIGERRCNNLLSPASAWHPLGVAGAAVDDDPPSKTISVSRDTALRRNKTNDRANLKSASPTLPLPPQSHQSVPFSLSSLGWHRDGPRQLSHFFVN